MTDKEILNGYCEKECKDFLQCGFSNKEHCPFHKGIKYGLTEGRKEGAKDFNVLSKENTELKEHCEAVDEVIEKMKRCTNCDNYSEQYGLCIFSGGDEDYHCRNRKWKLKE